MAYDIKKLYRTSADCVPGDVRHYDYISSDAITAAGYFPADSALRGGDIVSKLAITVSAGLVSAVARTDYYVTNASDGTLTLVAL
jgi:hypothetical protein